MLTIIFNLFSGNIKENSYDYLITILFNENKIKFSSL